MKVLSLLACVSIAVVYAQLPPKCSTPNQWSAYRVRHDPAQNISVHERYYYDRTLQRKRHDEEIFPKGQLGQHIQIFNFYTEKKEYRYNAASRECNVTTLQHDFRVYGVQPDDMFLGEFYIGAPFKEETILVTSWAGNRTESTRTGRYITVWTMKGCLPVSETFFPNNQEVPEHEQYYNVTVGVPPEAFYLPPSCGKL